MLSGSALLESVTFYYQAPVDMTSWERHEGMVISAAFDYAQVRGLSTEVREKLERVRPDTLGQASRIPGMAPAAVSLLLVHLKRTQHRVA